ncbi:MAG TPA: glycine cleavage system protein GcvH [Bacteroidota bacterium]|nr:glycine cleavage system protein GcvH [Bacteroidota bacterium]
MEFPKDIRYTRDHEWVRINGDTGVVGITDYAQGELGDIVFVELPARGKKIKRGESMGTIEAVKAVSDLYAPLTGEVVEVNPELEKNSELVNKEPYGKGWMIRIRMADKNEVASLLDDAAYRALVGK